VEKKIEVASGLTMCSRSGDWQNPDSAANLAGMRTRSMIHVGAKMRRPPVPLISFLNRFSGLWSPCFPRSTEKVTN